MRHSPSRSIEEAKVAAVARALWEQEGKPAGRELDHWMHALSLVALKNSQRNIAREDSVNQLKLFQPIPTLPQVSKSAERC